MTNFRALCADLVDALTAHGQPDDAAVGYVAGLLTRARDALAEPEIPSESPTDGELELLADRHMITDGQTGAVHLEHLDFARAVLARWGK